MAFSRPWRWIGPLLLAWCTAGCEKGKTSVLLDITGDPNVDTLSLDVSLSTGGQVSRSFPLEKPLPGRVVIQLPDLAQVVTIEVTGTGLGIELTDQAVVTARPYEQVKASLQLGQPAVADLRPIGDQGPADLGMPDLFGADFAADLTAIPPDDLLPGPDLTSSDITPLSLPDDSLVVLAGRYGGEGRHDDVGTDARFMATSGIARVGNTLYVAEYYTGRLRTVDLTTRQTGTVALTRASDGANTSIAETASLVYDGSTYLYAASYGQHVIRRIELASGKVSILTGTLNSSGTADGDPATARFFQPWGLAFDMSGFLWVADSGNDRLRKIDLTGTPMVTTPALTTMAGADLAGVTTWLEPHGMTRDGAYLYVSDAGGVMRVDPATELVVNIVPRNKLDSATDVAVVGTDLFVLDYSLNSVWRFPLAMPQNGMLIAGANIYAQLSEDGVGAAARFQNPQFMALDVNNDLLISEYTAIRRLVPATNTVTTVAGLGDHSGIQNGSGEQALLRSPGGVLYDGADTIYFTDYEGHRIRKYTISTHDVSPVAGNGNPSYADGPALSAEFYGPAGLALDAAGRLYITEDLNQTVRMFDPATNMVTTIAGAAGMDAPAGADGLPGLDNRLSAPCGIVFDGDHTLFLSERSNSQVRTIDVSTSAHTMAVLLGTGVRDVHDDPIGKMARMDGPCGMAYDKAKKHLFIAEMNSHLVRKADLSAANHPVTTLSGIAYGSFTLSIPPGNNGPLAGTRHRSPQWLALSSDGTRLYVSNRDGDTVQRLDLANNLSTTVVGVPLSGYVKPGPLPATLQGPEGIALTPMGLVIACFAENTLLLATDIAP